MNDVFSCMWTKKQNWIYIGTEGNQSQCKSVNIKNLSQGRFFFFLRIEYFYSWSSIAIMSWSIAMVSKIRIRDRGEDKLFCKEICFRFIAPSKISKELHFALTLWLIACLWQHIQWMANISPLFIARIKTNI